MAKSRIVVDGSNIATEGRSYPSLAQLEAALAELRKEHPKAEITVVVDATFAHRIDPSEKKRFEAAMAKGEYITPPAGAIGRGDAFVLKIAEKSKAIVLSNDSFQEFHGDHAWLFESDRLLGASPVPGVGWIFIPRSPVRGAKSRASVRGVRDLPPMPTPKSPPPGRAKKVSTASAAVEKKVEAPIRERAARRVATSVAAVNDPTTFITFIASHPIGEMIEAEVESFTSHGAIIRYQKVQCYAPLSGLGSPAPRSPREVLARGEIRQFVIRGLDPERRGIELALPEAVSGEITEARLVEPPLETQVPLRRRAVKSAASKKTAVKPTAEKSEAAAPSRTARTAKRSPSKGVSSKSVTQTDGIEKAPAPRKKAAKKVVSERATPAKTPSKASAANTPAVDKRAKSSIAPKRGSQPKAAKKAPAAKSAPTKRAGTKTATKAKATKS